MKFQRVGLIGKPQDVAAIQLVNKVLQFLVERGCEIFLDEQTGQMLPGAEQPRLPVEDLGRECDLVIVVGGDGSMLRASHQLAGQPVAVLGINRGYLGFLTDVNPEQFETQIEEVLAGAYVYEQRFLLDVSVWRDGECIGQSSALNEAVLHYGKIIQMIDFEVSIDGQFVNRQRSDGLIVATPTGSTAYALSGGGPIVYPNTDAMVLVPIFPHTLTYRPIVVRASSRIELLVTEDKAQYPRLGCDSQQYFSLQSGDKILIRKSEDLLNLIHPQSYNYYAVLREKLHWGKASQPFSGQ